MKKRIITISREFGSGGRTIGKIISEKLGIAYYDKELVKQVAVETGFHENFVEQAGEHAPAKNAFAYVFSPRGSHDIMNGMSVDDFLWSIQYKIITELAEKEPCVIVGRCADYILKDRSDCLNVFIHAEISKRADRVVRLYGETEENIQKRITDKDKKRKVYYKHYTEREWGMSQNYHLALDSGIIGIQKCADIVIDLVSD